MASEVLRPATNFVMDGMRMLSGIVPDKHKLGRKESFMPHARKIDPFFIVVTDADEKSFNVLGPMSDDTQINHLVVLCQNQGRKVNCHTAGLGQSREQIITSYTRQSGFAYSAEPIAA